MRVTDRQLDQYLARALEPPAADEVRRALAASAPLRARLARRQLADALTDALAGTPADSPVLVGWSLPPPGTPTGLAGGVSTAALMDPQAMGWIEVTLDLVAERLGDAVVVLERGADWQVTFPTEDDEELLASMLEIAPDGQRRLDLMPGPETQRLAVVLCPRDLARTRDWNELRERLLSGELPVVTVEVAASRGG